MDYRPLNTALDELRLISLLEPVSDHGSKPSALPSPEDDSLVHCVIEHYPLSEESWAQGAISQHRSAFLDWTTKIQTVESEASRRNGLDDGKGRPDRLRFHWGDFVALSYTWGDAQDKKEIVVDGKKVKVQSNLEAALRVLQYKKPLRTGYRIWIDALCINQGDNEEKSREVKRMRLIYKMAADVVIWLGPAAQNSDSAFDLMHTLSDSCKNGTDKALGTALRNDLNHLGLGPWLALSHLLNRSYFSRMWIIQEMCLGGSKAPILCGWKSISWDDFFRALYTFGKHNVDVIFACIDHERKAEGLRPHGLNRNKIIHINDEHQKQAGRAPAQYMPLLDLARQSDASNLRDKIYGILGLMAPNVVPLVGLDYGHSVEQVYTDFARQYIQATNSLEILEQCRLVGSAMPSWVPDWRNKNHYRLFSGRHSTYLAGRPSSAVYSFRFEGRVLDVAGIIIDTVQGLGEAYFEHTTSSKVEDKMCPPDNNNNVYGTEASLKDALWRTLTGDRTLQGLPAPASYSEVLDLPLREHCRNALPSRGARAFSRFLTRSCSLCVAGRRLDSYFSNTPDGFPKTAVDAVERIWRFVRTRRLVVTHSGRIGMVPNEARKGDVIGILVGTDVPILLRKGENTDGSFSLVGTCYIHGVMAGEAMQWVEDGISTVKTISIS
ncbi:HET-domain-containing protein [Karstenula rhodostoma CBS 690.94]|uniref:HET-domain-containing protein n=1 Tax=Karstenula rhodostoma CBS 690.94 TaxID=1392251 RepID=A0A9P4P9K8_9PLEO|nr:HET-domain-containing protein [Karstenula rhodostoma CBS 690.94]